ncbi:hypothetical protein RM812_14005 [Streptomyces sp. DSM 40712]|uniref:Uncharacterized protein n=2 Tax=Streptomyces lancefieldiae TaxID=3075520 RepID=A0ABU3AMB5_9ACTN|nr:hypothetical protein [Streptomyces sp. DSM 40712]
MAAIVPAAECTPCGGRSPLLRANRLQRSASTLGNCELPVLSPGSWTGIGSIPAGESAFSFPMPEVPGAAVRATCRRPDGSSAESPVVFVYSPVHSARRHTHDSGPPLSHDSTTQALFTDERAARRFGTDLLRLRVLTTGMSAPRVSPATESATSTVVTSGVDRWDAYLADCRRMIGLPLAGLAFGTAQIDLPQPSASRWIVSTVTIAASAEEDEAYDEGTEDEDPTVDGAVAVPYVPPEQRTRCRVWAQRWADTLVDPNGSPAQPLPVRLLVAGLYVQLLAAGVWDDDDHSWREGLSGLLGALDPQGGPDDGTAEQQAPPETGRRVDAMAAVLMTLLSQGATFTGGGEHDVQAACAWQEHKGMIARADPAGAEDLMLPPEQALARVAPWSEVERLVDRAKEDDPNAEVIGELSKAGWSVRYEDGIWDITGSFENLIPVVARAADRLGRHHADGVLVRARGRRRWAFAAWAKPLLVLLNPPVRVWRTYEVRSPGHTGVTVQRR